MIPKKAQQSVGMSFGMIFSIILIVIFVAFAFMAIKFFLNFGSSSQVVQFYESFQGEIDNAWSSASVEKPYEINLPKKITHICFANFSAPLTADQELSSQIKSYDYESNLFLIPQKAAFGFKSKTIEHLEISKITRNQNPYCIPNPGVIIIKKELGSKKVIVE